jgi:hypothetical protein
VEQEDLAIPAHLLPIERPFTWEPHSRKQPTSGEILQTIDVLRQAGPNQWIIEALFQTVERDWPGYRLVYLPQILDRHLVRRAGEYPPLFKAGLFESRRDADEG